MINRYTHLLLTTKQQFLSNVVIRYLIVQYNESEQTDIVSKLHAIHDNRTKKQDLFYRKYSAQCLDRFYIMDDNRKPVIKRILTKQLDDDVDKAKKFAEWIEKNDVLEYTKLFGKDKGNGIFELENGDPCVDVNKSKQDLTQQKEPLVSNFMNNVSVATHIYYVLMKGIPPPYTGTTEDEYNSWSNWDDFNEEEKYTFDPPKDESVYKNCLLGPHGPTALNIFNIDWLLSNTDDVFGSTLRDKIFFLNLHFFAYLYTIKDDAERTKIESTAHKLSSDNRLLLTTIEKGVVDDHMKPAYDMDVPFKIYYDQMMRIQELRGQLSKFIREKLIAYQEPSWLTHMNKSIRVFSTMDETNFKVPMEGQPFEESNMASFIDRVATFDVIVNVLNHKKK